MSDPAADMALPYGISKNAARQAMMIAENPDVVEEVRRRARENGEVLTVGDVIKAIKKKQDKQVKRTFDAPRRPSSAPIIYRSRPIKRRRTKAEMASLRDALYQVLAQENPMTVRQVFYRLVSMGAIEKTEGEYKNAVGRLLVDMREKGIIPFDWIADNTRWMRKPRTYSSLEMALHRTAETYRRSIWDNQDVYVEVWLEKDALAGVLYEETEKWDVPLMVVRGYSSLTFLYGAAETIAAYGKPAYLYYFGDYDPSGLNIPRTIEKSIRKYAPGVDVHFQRVAVTLEQIAKWNLATRPTKKTDTRSKNFEGESVEVDAIQSHDLRELARACIEQHIDKYILEQTVLIEEQERETLNMVLNTMDFDTYE